MLKHVLLLQEKFYKYHEKVSDKTNLGFHFTTKISEPLLKRDGITLEQFNNINGTSLKMGEYFEEPSNISNIKDFMCADKSILEAQHGKPIYTPKEIYVVTDERTFSAAFHFAYMMHKMGATIVGVTSGQAPNTFMELTPFKLPYSGLECSVSNSLQICFPKNHPMTKDHYISFLEAVSDHGVQFEKLYPEGNAETRFKINGIRCIYAYCNRHGLFQLKR